MNALIGSRLNVIGSSIATVSAGPMPGSTPTSRAEHHAGERPAEMRPREGARKPAAKQLERVHARSYSHPASTPAGSDNCSTRAKTR